MVGAGKRNPSGRKDRGRGCSVMKCWCSLRRCPPPDGGATSPARPACRGHYPVGPERDRSMTRNNRPTSRASTTKKATTSSSIEHSSTRCFRVSEGICHPNLIAVIAEARVDQRILMKSCRSEIPAAIPRGLLASPGSACEMCTPSSEDDNSCSRERRGGS